MTLYYSAGDGLGHLTRSLALIKQLQLQQVHLLHTTTMDISGRENILKTIALKKGQIPYHLFQKAKTLYLDSFPVGLTGTLQPYLYRHCPESGLCSSPFKLEKLFEAPKRPFTLF